ncbi:hypothetical protein [Geomonas subterranea]|uniref:Uncharacterized protein n=1 Tax=Geomonas subterranea TaxID=2847989 RepID=A0ABX8LEN4_9BACT|nr:MULTISPECIES: hypothetical protein [Geomonas]QXE89341.1 hypothetical protein KP001_12835 [Geomonas subterranea]QXM08544.1 hypothetical protein KP002_16435 [Geomonas subterranea]
MKTKMRLPALVNTAVVFLMTTANAFAASTSKVFVSKMGILLFLGFCALVLVVQLIPALITLYGMLKGIGKEQEKSPSRVKGH